MQSREPEAHRFCFANLSTEDMLKSAVIEEKKFKHSTWAGADNPLGPKLWWQQEDLITTVICCKFEKNPSTSDFIHIFLWFNKCIEPQVRGRQLQGTTFWCQQKPLVTSVICYKYKKKISLKSDFIQFFSWFYICIDSPGAGADNPLGTKFYVNRNILSLRSFVKKISLKSDFIHYFSWFLYMYEACWEIIETLAFYPEHNDVGKQIRHE